MAKKIPAIINQTVSAIFMLLFLLVILIMLLDTTSPVEVQVKKIKGVADTIQHFQSASLVGPGYLSISHAQPMIRYLAPRMDFDPFYFLLLLIGGVLYQIYFADFNYKNPFTTKAYRGLKISLWILLVFLTVDFWRHEWFNNEIREMTKDQYSLHQPLIIITPVYLTGFILLRVLWIFKKGLSLQNESELTV